jgi:GR25 family glycosyltransferase involved in LPS biosynthesis
MKKRKNKDLEWTWAGKNNDTKRKCPITGLTQFPYTTNDIRKKIGCSMSHYLLWEKCMKDKDDEPYLILEHDSVFINSFPTGFTFYGICQVNDPKGATRRGNWWSQEIKKKGNGVRTKTWVTKENERDIPDGLAGNSAYLIRPQFVKEVIDKTKEVGLWPNDAIICQQIFPYLEECYPFITEVKQEKSTTV